MRGLHHEPGTDSASPVGERRVHDLEPSPPLRDDDAAARDHFIGCRVESDVPTPVSGAEVVAEVGEADSAERAALVLILSRIPVLDLKLDERSRHRNRALSVAAHAIKTRGTRKRPDGALSTCDHCVTAQRHDGSVVREAGG